MMANFGNLMRRTLILALSVFVGSALLAAQSTTDGAIGGTVADSTGAVVAKAQIVIHNNGTNAEHTVTADDSGYYRVVSLQPGTYTVSVNHQGFATYKAELVIVQVGSVTEVSPRLTVGGGQEVVQVTATAPQINYTSPEFAPTLDQMAISNLPINGGRWSNFALLTPGVVSDSNAFGLLSFRGISTLLNNNTVDGADNNQAFFSEERGRTRIGYSTPKEAVQEFQVNTSNYSAEYGRSAGGVVNTVTKSGTNGIHGEAYFNDRDNDIGAFNEFAQINVQNSSGAFVSEPLKPTNKRQIAGFGVGGPLVKDKLFWFVAYDWFHNNFPGVAVTSNPNAFFAQPTCSSADTPGHIVFPCTGTSTIGTLATRLGQTQTAALATYNSDLGALNTLLGVVPRTGDQDILFPKLDWQINAKNHASFSFNRMRWTSPAGIQTAATVTRGIASFGNDYVKDTWGVAKLDTSITPNIINEARFQYGRDFEYEFSQPPAPYELSNLVNAPSFTNPFGLPPSVSISNGFTFGVPTFLQRPAFPDEARAQIADTISWNHGNHTFKFGFDTSHVNDNSQNLASQFGSYSYGSLLAFFSDLNKPNTCSGKPCYNSAGYSQAFGPIGFEFQTNDVAFFAADDWKVMRRLSLSLGVRWEYEMLPSPFTNLINPAVPQTAQMPHDMNNFGPRVGFAWDVFGNAKTVLRGGYGLYYGRVINSTIFSALTATGMPGGQTSFSFSPGAGPVFPAVFSTPPAGAGKNIVYFDPHFQDPQIQQLDLTLEHDLGWGTVLSVSYLGSLGRELPDFVDTNAPLNNIGNITYQVTNGGPLKGATYSTELFKPFSLTQTRPNAAFGSMSDIFSGINSSYHALVVQANHRMSRNIQFSASYTWSHAIDDGQNQTTFSGTNFLLFPNNVGAEKGNSIYDIPNRFVANAIITSPWKKTGWLGWFTNGWQFSPITQLQNGLPYTLSVSGSAPGGAISGINGSGGTNRIDVLGNNSFRMPSQWEQDFRISKTFTFEEKYKLELMTDFFNVPNKQNVMTVNNLGYSIVTSGAVLTPSGSVACGNGVGVNPLPCLNFNVNSAAGANFAPLFGTVTGTNNSNFLWTPRQIQLGARFSF
jgi:Carboxypeptidase regulatory-like domain